MLSTAELAALRATCLHEYAHLAVARHFGACGFVAIRRDASAGLHRASWHGRFQLFGPLQDDEWRIVAIAGTIAERMADGAAEDAALLDASLRCPETLSPCDAALARGHDVDDVRRCIEIVRDAWPDIVRDAMEREEEVLRDYPRSAGRTVAG